MADITKINLKGTLLNIKDQYAYHNGDLATVATSGSYNDLQDKPNIPAGVTVDQEITQNGTNPVKGGAIYDALENTKTFIVNVTIDYVNDTITADKTFAEINAAISGGRVVEVNHEGDIYLLAVITPFVDQFYFVYSSPEDSSRYVLSVTERDVWAREEMLIATTGLLRNYVPVTRKINSKPLVGDLELTASDVGALPSTTVIPAAQIQSDWNQTTTTEVDYIKNKPTIPDVSGFATTTAMNTALAGKQDTLTFDTTPTANSTNPVTSGGIKTYVDGKATITGITTSQDGTFTISLSDGNSYTVNLNHVHPQYLKYELLADEAAYTALATKDSSTLYLIPEA